VSQTVTCHLTSTDYGGPGSGLIAAPNTQAVGS